NTTKLTNLTGATQNVRLDVSNEAFRIVQPDTNHVRLYNYSGSTQYLRLDVLGAGTRNSGYVSLAPLSADVDATNYSNSIWINKTGLDGTMLDLQKNGTQVLGVQQTG